MKFIFVTGGVVSSIGKGITSATIGSLLQARGYSVHLRKMDPYFNIDPGTMSPYQHGEVFVTDDGAETDLDLGHYERFTNTPCNKFDSVSSGKIYDNVLKKERKGDYLGNTVQIIPHITDEIKAYITNGLNGEDFIICEIGGTVGDIEANPFLEAIRQFANDVGRDNVMFVHVTLLPYLKNSKEVKTKPTQHSVKELQRVGITANIILCRTEVSIDDTAKRKLALFCNVNEKNVIEALDCENLYEVVLNYHKEGLDSRIIEYFNLPNIEPKLDLWNNLVKASSNLKEEVNLYVIGKYVGLKDAYKSLEEAIKHGGISNSAKVHINWLDADNLEQPNVNLSNILANAHGILIPGGFGDRGIEGKMKAITYARENNIPCFGICLGMQLMVIEAMRNIAKITSVGSTEFGEYDNKVISLLTEWMKGEQLEQRNLNSDKGGTMRLGAYPCNLIPNSLVSKIYNTNVISERHRHRYEVNMNYKEDLSKAGFIMSGLSPDGLLPEIMERQDHRWFLGVQFHPELKSRPYDPHPIFNSFIAELVKFKNNK
ncbi:CTP synthase [Rickettsiales bacterium LUAb2]